MNPQAIASIAPIDTDALVMRQVSMPTQGFGNMVTQGIEQMNQQLVQSQTALQSLALGETQNLHQTMIQMEETRTAVQLVLQVRSRLLEAYQDVMKMSI